MGQFDLKLKHQLKVKLLIGFICLLFQLLLGFESGTVVVWSLRGKTAEHRCVCPQVSREGVHFIRNAIEAFSLVCDGTI